MQKGLRAIWLLVAMLTVWGCTDNNFSGSAGKESSSDAKTTSTPSKDNDNPSDSNDTPSKSGNNDGDNNPDDKVNTSTDDASNDIDTGEGEDEAADCDLDSDFLELKYPDEIEKCRKKGRVWDFDSKKCASISKNKSFECKWDDIKDVTFADILPPGVKKKNAKLVGCGEAHGGDTVVWQFTLLPEENKDKKSCKYSGSMAIWTLCSSKDPDFAKKLMGKDQKEAVQACLDL